MSEDLGSVNLVELLDRLEPVPPPQAVSLWPQTAGWLWLGLALAILAAWLLHRWLLHRSANAYRRAALEEIKVAGADAAALARILRRSALAAFPRAEVAALQGEDWLAFLDRTYGGTGFQRGPGRLLAAAPYAPATTTADLSPLAAEWVLLHRRPKAGRP